MSNTPYWLSSRPPVDTPFTLNRASPQANGLVAWWPSMGYEGGILVDRAYGFRSGTLTNGPVWTPDPVMGTTLSLDGTDDFVNCGTVASPFGTGDVAYTIALWVRPDAIRFGGMWVGYGNATANQAIGIGSTGSNFYSVHYSNDNNWGIAVATGSTYHVAVTYDPSTSTETLYLNGFAAGSWTPANLNIQASDLLYIGRSPWNGTYANTCRLGDVRIYNRPLGAAEIFQLYAPQTRWQLYAPDTRTTLAYPAPTNAPSAAATYAPLQDTGLPPIDIYLCDGYGRVLISVNRFEWLSFSMRQNATGEFELILPLGFNERLLRDTGIIDVWIAPDRSSWPHRLFTGFTLDEHQVFVAEGKKFARIVGKDVNYILESRVHVENAALIDYPDNTMRYVTGRNAGAGGGPGRAWSHLNLTVEPRKSWGRAISQQAALGQGVDAITRGVAKKIAEDPFTPTRLYHGIIVSGFNPPTMQYVVRKNLWGVDRTTGGSRVIFRPGFGLKDVSLVRESSDEANVIMYASSGSVAALTEAETVRGNRALSGLGARRESFYNGSDQSDTDAALAARWQMRARRHRWRVLGTIVQDPSLMYDKHYRLGDQVAFQTDTIVSTVRIDSVNYSIAGGERQIDVKHEYY